jgi:hypothetical protein
MIEAATSPASITLAYGLAYRPGVEGRLDDSISRNG